MSDRTMRRRSFIALTLAAIPGLALRNSAPAPAETIKPWKPLEVSFAPLPADSIVIRDAGGFLVPHEFVDDLVRIRDYANFRRPFTVEAEFCPPVKMNKL